MPDLLMVDDNPAVSKALGVRMRAAGLSVRCAMSGRAALDMVREQPPDVMLLDVRMPGLDGIEVCRRLKADPQTAGFPIVFLSAETSEQTREAAIDAGGERFMSKPYDAPILIDVINEVVAKS